MNQKNTHSKKSSRSLPKTAHAFTPIPPTQRSINATLPFGLIPTTQPKHNQHTQLSTPTKTITNNIQAAKITHITGPSGSGKSTLLQALQHTLPNVITPANLTQPHTPLPLTDLFSLPLNQTLSLLSAAGLAEPKLWPRPHSTLSADQQARLDIALLVANAIQQKHNSTILLDEFCSNLDRFTARSVCSSLRKLIDKSTTHHNINIVTAAAHEDIPTLLDTNLLIQTSNHKPYQTILQSQYTDEPITIEPTTLKDYHALKHHHYISNDPANPCHALRATRPHPVTHRPTLAAVLVITHPTLNASWRKRAWPGRYNSGNKRNDALRLNNELRTIARVITAPHSRALGIATQLVTAYLRNPLTPATESIAAMGNISPFFKNAGMTEYPIPHSPTDLRLLDTLHHLNRTPESLLFHPLPLGEGLGEDLSFSSPDPLLQRELKTWARSKNLNANDPNLPAHAAFKLLTNPCAYTHVQQHKQEHNT